MGMMTCPNCKRNHYRWNNECYCGYSFKKNLIKINSEVEVSEDIDTLITWSRKSTKKQKEEGAGERVYYYHNLSTGKQSSELSDVTTERRFRLLDKKSGIKKGIFIKEDTKNNYITFVLCYISTSAPKNGEIRHWEELCRMYLAKDKTLYYEPISWVKEDGSWKEKKMFDNKFVSTHFKLLNVSFDITKTIYINDVDDNWDNFKHEIRNFIPETYIVKLSGNKMLHVNSPCSFAEYMKVKTSNNVRKGPKQEKVDELTAIKLGPVEKPENVVAGLTDRVRVCKIGTNVDSFATLEAVPGVENTCVLRTFSSIPGEDDVIQEGYRMYVQGKEIYICKTNIDGKFVYTPMFKNPTNWNFSLNDFDVSITKGTLLEYFGSVINKIDINARSKAIWAFCKWPIFEQLSKSGYINITNWILNNSVMSNPEDVLKIMFGSDLKGKSLYNKLGLNKNQMDYVETNINCMRNMRTEYYDKGFFSAVTFIKYIMDDEKNSNYYNYYRRFNANNNYASIANLDDDTFKLYVDFYINCLDKLGVDKYVSNEISYTAYDSTSYNYREITCYNKENASTKMSLMAVCLTLIKKIYSGTSAINMLNLLQEIVDKRLTEIVNGWRNQTYESYKEPLLLYRDYLLMVMQCNDSKNLRAKFKDIEHIKDMHDSLSLIVKINKDKIVLDNFRKRAKESNKWEYSEDTYMVISPKEPVELAKEGNELHHCVKSYIERVANGSTNIMFIREAEKADVPFFTVEISNIGVIEQVHGFANCIVEPGSELSKFITRWVKSCKLKTNNINKVR